MNEILSSVGNELVEKTRVMRIWAWERFKADLAIGHSPRERKKLLSWRRVQWCDDEIRRLEEDEQNWKEYRAQYAQTVSRVIDELFAK